MMSCCLCNEPLLTDTALKKHIFLHGKACEKSKQILNTVMLETVRQPLACFKETVDPGAFLCSLCDGLVTKTLKISRRNSKNQGNHCWKSCSFN